MGDEALPKSIALIDRVVHSPHRLMILAFLAAVDGADFTFLMNQLGLTRGNLSTHLRVLEEAGYIEAEKGFVDRIPRTLLRLTDAGRAAIREYGDRMRAIIEGMLA